MSAPSKPATPGTEPDRLPRVLRALAVVERLGNALPHPFWLFWILAAILGVTSARSTRGRRSGSVPGTVCLEVAVMTRPPAARAQSARRANRAP